MIGEIIYRNRFDGMNERVVADANWFGTNIIGALLEPTGWGEKSQSADSDGRLSLSALRDKLALTEENSDAVLTLLEHMLLIYPVDNPPTRYVVPALLSNNTMEGMQRWFEGKTNDFTWVCGRRFECVDDKDRLTFGMFPRLQCRVTHHISIEGTRYETEVIGLWPTAAWIRFRESEFFITVPTDLRCKCENHFRVVRVGLLLERELLSMISEQQMLSVQRD